MKLTHPFVIAAVLVAGAAGFVLWNESRRDADARELAAMPVEQQVEVKAERALPKKATADELSGLRLLRERWTASEQLATSTARMSLSPVILRLQDIRAEAASMPLGECLEPTRKPLLRIMDDRIQSLIEFLSSASSFTAEVALSEKMREREITANNATAEIEMQVRICTAA